MRFCPLCEGGEAKPALETGVFSGSGAEYTIARCLKCGFMYTDPIPGEAEMHRLYGRDFYNTGKPRAGSWDFIRVALYRIFLSGRHRALMSKQPGRILDVGCGNGDFLARLSKS
ncbi:MAG TPA: hypothetical protein VJX67_26065, partial [Blastocatellia bacterium]|nr:hypothetical protein [Blastocatellia bacterium]